MTFCSAAVSLSFPFLFKASRFCWLFLALKHWLATQVVEEHVVILLSQSRGCRSPQSFASCLFFFFFSYFLQLQELPSLQRQSSFFSTLFFFTLVSYFFFSSNYCLLKLAVAPHSWHSDVLSLYFCHVDFRVNSIVARCYRPV